ncbi:NmrA family NAD(P)-binding protein [Dyadobacter psychrotolerans]|uniref:NAD-dependent epimerase/dehydratase family protein n=1 Tax=Dyadobacter psychrotolerans TaxID=2541721 RepID=A0A4R5DKX3_9BACT|nr:NmrA family NAD(P)-binding protein [Dyadobacter psychrotolerans]TDE14852.1 NAD-dependent epimerase/dehydratase family protein [Dyadobacter psychrotolerans]
MYIILGASGHVGSVVAETLLNEGQQVTIITRDEKKTEFWKQKGATVAIADVHDVKTLNQVFRRGKRLFLLNPPAAPGSDTAVEERKTVDKILEALDNSGLDSIVAQSTYGAQPGNQLGDLGVLYDMEQLLEKKPFPVSIIRAAYYMSNWEASLLSARKEGIVNTLYPVDFKLPMVAPADMGRFAAKILMQPADGNRIYNIEGPQMYSAQEVAAGFQKVLNRDVKAVETPRENWIETLEKKSASPIRQLSLWLI